MKRSKVLTRYRVASEQIQMFLMELGIPQTIWALLKTGERLSYYILFINPVDNLMASPSKAAIATGDLYRNKNRQDATETVMWWRRIQRMETMAFGDFCTWTPALQEVAFSCLIEGSRYPQEMARAANKKLLFSPNYEVCLDHLKDLMRAVGEARSLEELTHHLTLHPNDTSYDAGPVRRKAPSS